MRKPGLCIITLVKRCLLQEKKELDDTEQREPLNEKPKENWDEELNEEGQVRIRVFFKNILCLVSLFAVNRRNRMKSIENRNDENKL